MFVVFGCWFALVSGLVALLVLYRHRLHSGSILPEEKEVFLKRYRFICAAMKYYIWGLLILFLILGFIGLFLPK